MTDIAKANKATPQAFIKDLNVQKMITERLQKRAPQFTTSLLSLVNSNSKIAECTPITIVQAALTAASMDLPINQNLGFAYIVPFKNHGIMEAQFQMGWKGLVQLAQRSGVFETINTTDVREGELKVRDRMTGVQEFTWIEDDTERNAKPVIGYLAYFKLLNGFSKSVFLTKAEVEAHAGRYSQSYKGGYNSPWKTDFDLMAQKTALKQLFKYAPMSTELQEATEADQSVIGEDGRKQYVDNDDLAGEHADEDQKNDIIAANKKAAEKAAKTKEAEVTPPQSDDNNS